MLAAMIRLINRAPNVSPPIDWATLLDSARDLASAQIDKEVLDMPRANRAVTRLAGQGSILFMWAVLRAGVTSPSGRTAN